MAEQDRPEIGKGLEQLEGAVSWGIRESDNPTDPRNPMVAPSPEMRAFLEGANAILRSLRREQPEHPLLENLMRVYLTAKGAKFLTGTTTLGGEERDPLRVVDIMGGSLGRGEPL